MGRRLAACVGAMLLCSGCPTDTEPLISLYEPGDPCRSTQQFCADASSVLRCVDDVWTVNPCTEACAELGPAYVGETCSDDECECELADPNGCAPQETECASADALSVCDEAQGWQLVDCQEVCAGQGASSLGCMAPADEPASCWCTGEGSPCDPSQAPVCADTVTLARCQDGVWVFEDCGSGCDEGGQCRPLAMPADCACS